VAVDPDSVVPPPSDPCTVNRTVPCVLPPPPGKPTAIRHDRAVDLVWDPNYFRPAGAANVPNIQYLIRDADRGTTWTVQADVTHDVQVARITRLSNGFSYRFTVAAQNAYGSGKRSVASDAVVPAGRPFAPTGVSATPGNSSATVSWAAARNNGAAILRYTVTTYPGGATTTATGTSVTVGGLTNGKGYYFKVTATNAVGTSAASAPSNTVVPHQSTPLWGIDSASYETTSFMNSVSAYWGHADFAGGYFGNRANLTPYYVSSLHSSGYPLLLVDNDLGYTTEGANQCTGNGCVLHGYANGGNAGRNSVKNARNLGAASGTGLFIDIEGGSNIDADWIRGYFDAVDPSEFVAGFYASTCTRCGFTFAGSYCSAVKTEPAVGSRSIMFTMYHNPGRTTKADAPRFAPVPPACAGNTLVWQYGEPGSNPKGPNVDTDLVHPSAVGLLW
jgi:hypothetical protein